MTFKTIIQRDSINFLAKTTANISPSLFADPIVANGLNNYLQFFHLSTKFFYIRNKAANIKNQYWRCPNPTKLTVETKTQCYSLITDIRKY